MEFKELQRLVNEEFGFCWLCGRSDCLTVHHVIPQKLRGARVNLTVPMCRNCQLILHKEDEFVALLRKLVF